MGGLHGPSSLTIRPAPVHFMLSKSLSIIKLAGAAGMGVFRAGGRGKKGTVTCTPYLLRARRPQIVCSFPMKFSVISLRFYLLSAIEIL